MRDTRYRDKVLRTLDVIDEANRGGLGIDIGVCLPASTVTVFLAQMIDLPGRPQAIRCDNGPEPTSRVFTDGCKQQDIALRCMQPGKPDQNADIERFDRTYREEVLGACLFASLKVVQDLTSERVARYNEIHHDALGSLPPARHRELVLASRNSSLELSA